MRGLIGLASFVLATSLGAGDLPLVGSWIVHIDNSVFHQWRVPDLTPESICLTFRPDGRFEMQARMSPEGEAFGGSIAGRYRLEGRRLILERPGSEPVVEFVEVDARRLKLVTEPGKAPGLEFERTAWCGP